MATYFEDWSSDSTGAAPSSSRWTAYGFGAGGNWWTGKVEAPSGTKYIDFNDNGWGDALCGYYRTELGAYAPGGAEQIEFTCQFRFPSGQATNCFGVRFGHYYFASSSGTVWWMNKDDGGGGYIAGASAQSYTVTSNTWWWLRVRRSSSGVYTLWLWDASSSQGSALITSSADTTFTSGEIGFYAKNYNSLPNVRAFGIGTSGDAAPTSAASSGGVPKIMQAHARRRRM